METNVDILNIDYTVWTNGSSSFNHSQCYFHCQLHFAASPPLKMKWELAVIQCTV